MRRRTEEEVGPTVRLPRHRFFVGFFTLPVQAPTRIYPLHAYSASFQSPFTTRREVTDLYCFIKKTLVLIINCDYIDCIERFLNCGCIIIICLQYLQGPAF